MKSSALSLIITLQYTPDEAGLSFINISFFTGGFEQLYLGINIIIKIPFYLLLYKILKAYP